MAARSKRERAARREDIAEATRARKNAQRTGTQRQRMAGPTSFGNARARAESPTAIPRSSTTVALVGNVTLEG